MKKLIILGWILLSCSIVFASMGGPIGIQISGGGTPAGGVTAFCTAQTNGDLWCEDFQGATLCYSGEASTCRTAWTTVIETGGTVIFDNAIDANFSCNDTGSYSLEIARTSNAAVGACLDTVDTTGPYHFIGYFVVTANSIANYTHARFLYGGIASNSPDNQPAFQLEFYNDSTQTNLELDYYDSATTTTNLTSSTQISVNTQYKLEIYYQASTHLLVTLNGVDVWTDQGASVGTRNARYWWPAAGLTTASSNYTIEWTDIAIDNDTAPDACN